MDFKKTVLWKNSLGNEQYGYDELREKLIYAFLKAHGNAKYILDKIRNDFPNLTVHDISHVDGLWQVASVIIGSDYKVNPLEGFVLGCAFLMHDAALSYDAAGGVEYLRNLREWKDYYEDYKNDNSLNEDEKLFEADFRTIRRLHAKCAEQLHDQVFDKDDGSKFYVIDDKSLRAHYGELICKIAGSHHWNMDDVGTMDTQVPPSSIFPQEWRIDSLKLACILRCADAGHIDDGRAPDYLIELLKINGVSKNHWIAQNRLSQIDRDRYNPDKVIIKSNISFREEDFAAWNVAFDVVQVLDHELKASNELLKRKGSEAFAVQGVSGAVSREELSKYIKTDGWEPVEACVHISNVENLIKKLGGEKLYGREHKLEIVLRELIQNARDAICARMKIDSGFCDGKINVEIKQQKKGIWVSVSDNGVGMSIETVKDYFLNFGSSFWSSDLAKQEFVGLNSSGFKAVGEFGIGFYSIFMVAANVLVDTRRYDYSLDDNIQLKFPSGLCLRPIISHKRGKPNVSTSVNFLIDEDKEKWDGTYEIKPAIHGASPFKVPYESIIANITAGLDVDVYYSELGLDEKLIHKNINDIQEESPAVADWLKDITYARFRETPLYATYIDSNYKRLRKIIVDGKLKGFAALNTYWTSQGTFFDVSTIGGLASVSGGSDNGDYIGCLINEPITASREQNEGRLDRTEWAREQYRLLCEEGLSDRDKMYLPYTVGKYGIDMTELMWLTFLTHENRLLTCRLKQLIMNLVNNNRKFVIGLSSLMGKERVEIYLDTYRSAQILSKDEVLFVPVRNSGFLSVKENDDDFPINILWCINNASDTLGVTIHKTVEDKKAFSRIDGECSALVFTFSK